LDPVIERAAAYSPLAREAAALEFGFETRVLARLRSGEETFAGLFSQMLWRSAAALGPTVAALVLWFAFSHSINLATTASTTSDLVAELRHLATFASPF
jgi:hypothetical protein